MRHFSSGFYLFSLCLAALLAAPSIIQAAGIIDEGGLSPTEAGSAITNRPMRQSVELKKVQTAFDQAKPEANTKRYSYKLDQTIKVRLREYMQTVVILPEGESIFGNILGDATNFAFQKLPSYKNRFVLWGRDPGADTNLTVFGESGRIYSFYLRIDSVSSNYVPDLLVFIHDNTLTYKEVALLEQEEKDKTKDEKKVVEEECLDCKKEDYPPEQFTRDYLRDLPGLDRKKANHSYVMKGGSRDLAPQAVFDDGFMTYFKYGEHNLDAVKVPVIYQVRDGYDNIVNYRVEGGYIVMETVNDKWTIRRGEQYLCIENKKYKDNKPKSKMD